MYVNGCTSFPDSKLMKLCKVQNACIDYGILPPYAITPCQQLLEEVKCILLAAVVEIWHKAFEILDSRQVIWALLLLNVCDEC